MKIYNVPRGFNKGGWIETETCPTLGSSAWHQNHFVLVTPKSTSTPNKFINHTSLPTKTMETSPVSLPKTCPTLTYSLEASLASLLASLESEVALTTPEGQCSLNLREYCEQNNLDYSSLKTLKDFSATMAAELLQPSSKRLMNWGMTVNGKCLTAKITESHRTGKECSLSDILEEQVDPKYFLSETIQKRLLSYRDNVQTPLPPVITEGKQTERMSLKVNSMHKKSAD